MKATLLVALSLVSSVSAATFTVSTTNDSGPGSLRQAITDANAVSSDNPHRIEFAIAGSGVRTIAPASALPAVQRAMVIDGYTQPGATPNSSDTGHNGTLLIELSGGFGTVPVGLELNTNNSTIAGLVIKPSRLRRSKRWWSFLTDPPIVQARSNSRVP